MTATATKKWKNPWSRLLDAMFGEEKEGDEAELKRIGFRADLPKYLESQHAEIMRAWNKAADFVFDDDWKGVAVALEDFRAKLKGHSLLERMRLYGYLELEFNGVPKTREVRITFENEGESLERSLSDFISLCKTLPETDDEKAERIDSYALLSEKLSKRFAREENELFLHYRAAKN